MTAGPASTPVAPADDWLTAAVVEAVTDHMNDDHAADTLVMVRPVRPTAVSAIVVDVTRTCLIVRVTDPDGTSDDVALPWPSPLTERADIRRYVVELYETALADGPP